MVVSFERVPLNTAIRIKISLFILGVSFVILVMRLWYLQIVYGEYFRNRSENNRLRTVYIPSPRGLILDRNSTVLAQNRPAFNVTFVKEDSLHPQDTLKRVAELLKLDSDQFLEKLNKKNRRRRFEPQVLARDISRQELAKVLANKFDLPGISVEVRPTREYVHGNSAAHVLGYIREISAEQLEQSNFTGYLMGDLIGQYGIEKKHEYLLHGKRGLERVIVNARGTRIGKAFFEAEHAGHDVKLTIDHRLQELADQAMKGRRGAVIMMDANSGELLVLASYPSFDPNIFTGELTPELWKDLRTNPSKPLTNRTIKGLYPPGSIFKIVVGAAALAEQVIDPGERINCKGSFKVGRSRPFHCHKHAGHGLIGLQEAFEKSCNVYFYTLGQRLGIDRIHQYASAFGFATKTGLDLSEEAVGLLPSREWKRKYFSRKEDQRWYPGETPSVAIGQGATTITPLQITRMLAAIANNGTLVKPNIVQDITSTDGLYKDADFIDNAGVDTGISKSVLKRIRSYLLGVVNAEKGTGSRAKLDHPKYLSAGKTGTAQRRSVAAHELKSEQQDRESLAWFSGFAPFKNPEVVVTVLVEGGGHGGVTAAPIAKILWDEYFKLKELDAESEGMKIKDAT